MQTDMQKSKSTYVDDNQIDLLEMAEGYLRCVKKYWVLFGLIIVLTTVVFGILKPDSKVPEFCAKVTYSVQKVGDSNVDGYTAKSLSSAVKTVASMADFKEELLEQAGLKKGSVNYSLSTEYIEGSNLFTLKVFADDYKKANQLLEAIEIVYPAWASKLNGTVELQIMDRTRATDVPQNSFSFVGSYAKGALLGCVVCIAIATVYIFTVQTVRNEKDMKKITKKKCFSSIPDVVPKKRSKKAENSKERLLITYKRIDWGFQQTILTIQSRIEKEMRENGSKVLLVTSSIPQEGKSVITANLALAFAEHGKKVLIIDGDLRNPSTRAVFGEAASSVGLVEYFKGQAELSDILSVCSGLSVIDSGSTRSKVQEVIRETQMQKLMEKCREQFDIILIDTPPSHLFTDAAVLQKYADAVLYVVRSDRATVKEIEDGIAPFIRSKKLLGYVINRNQEEFSVYGKYGKYGYSKYGRYGKYQRYVQLDKDSMNTEDLL